MGYSLNEVINLIRKRFILITVCTMIGFILFYFINNYMIQPEYTASVKLYVDEGNSSMSLNELSYAQKVVSTYMNFLNTNVFYNKVIEESKIGITYSELKQATSIQSVNDTEIFQINVTTKDPTISYQLVSTMQKVVPELIVDIKQSASIRVVDPAIYTDIPSSPNILRNTIIGGMLGLFTSVFYVFIWNIVDVKIKNEEDLRKNFHLPILGCIPKFQQTSYKKNVLFTRKHNVIIKKSMNKAFLKNNNSFLEREAYKGLRTNLSFTILEEGCKKILVNSSLPEEGKTTTAINLAISFAQTGNKVLLIDCDLRKGKVHEYFHMKMIPGLSDIFTASDVNDNVIQNTSYKNLYILTAGTVPPNPAELLASSRMERLLASWEKKYDYIILDTPPVNVVSDALSLTKLVNGVAVVVRSNSSTLTQVSDAIIKYNLVKSNLLGFILNGVQMDQNIKGKNYYKYYENS